MESVVHRKIKTYCNSDSCSNNGACEYCAEPITVERTYNDEIKVVLPCGYTQRFWVDLTDIAAINRCIQMKEDGIK